MSNLIWGPTCEREGSPCGWINECMDEWIDGWMDGWMDEWIDEWMDGWMNVDVFKVTILHCKAPETTYANEMNFWCESCPWCRTNPSLLLCSPASSTQNVLLVAESMNGWMNGLMDGWMNGWMNGWMDRWMDEWMNVDVFKATILHCKAILRRRQPMLMTWNFGVNHAPGAGLIIQNVNLQCAITVLRLPSVRSGTSAQMVN